MQFDHLNFNEDDGLMSIEDLILKKIIKFFKLLKRRIEIFNAEAELEFILENK